MDRHSQRIIEQVPQSGRIEITFTELVYNLAEANLVTINGEIAEVISWEPLLELASLSYRVIYHENDFNYSLEWDKRTIPIYQLGNYIYVTDLDYMDCIEIGVFRW